MGAKVFVPGKEIGKDSRTVGVGGDLHEVGSEDSLWNWVLAFPCGLRAWSSGC